MPGGQPGGASTARRPSARSSPCRSCRSRGPRVRRAAGRRAAPSSVVIRSRSGTMPPGPAGGQRREGGVVVGHGASGSWDGVVGTRVVRTRVGRATREATARPVAWPRGPSTHSPSAESPTRSTSRRRSARERCRRHRRPATAPRRVVGADVGPGDGARGRPAATVRPTHQRRQTPQRQDDDREGRPPRPGPSSRPDRSAHQSTRSRSRRPRRRRPRAGSSRP